MPCQDLLLVLFLHKGVSLFSHNRFPRPSNLSSITQGHVYDEGTNLDRITICIISYKVFLYKIFLHKDMHLVGLS